MAEALYRKYRPQVFEDVVGQEPIERTLKNAIVKDKVSHAYLFCGPRGTGKTTTARLLAKALLCEKGPTPDPDGTCEDCQLIAEGVHPDVYELDAASRTGVENVREEIISRVQFAPTRGRNKVYIIDEVHMLSTAAFNALLKTLEEPPSHVVFILCTTDPQKVPETIHSRCQRFDFHRIAPESMVARLGAICIAEDVEFEGEALDLIAHRAEGGLRNALTSLEQIIAFENGKVTLAGAERLLGSIDSNDLAEIMAYVGKRDIANCFRWTSAYVETGADLAQFVRDMAEHVRNLYILSLAGDDVELDVSETSRRELAGELQWFGPDRASRLLGVLGDLSAELKTSSNPRLAFEIALTRMVRPDSDLTLESLAERVEALESGYSAVAHVLPGRPLEVAPGDRSGQAQRGGEQLAASREAAPSAAAQPAAARPAAAQPAKREGGAAEPGSGGQPQEAFAPAAAQAASNERPAQAASAASIGDEARGPVPASKLSSLSNPAALQRIWQATLNAVKKEKQAYGVLFMNTKAVFDESAGAIRVLFPANSTFAFNAVQKPDVQDVLSQALAKAVGEPAPFCFEQMDGTASQGAPASRGEGGFQAPAQQAASPDPAGAAAQPMAQQPEAKPARSSSQASYEQVPYEEVPYGEVFYESVPYEELGEPAGGAHQQGAGPDAAEVAVDADTAPSPSDHRDENGALHEDPADIQAMLQAGFGSGVVISEVDD